MKRAAFLALAAFALSACDDETGPTHVALVGDSITAGDGASSPQQAYPAALQGMLGAKVHVDGFGRGGATVLGKGAGDLPYDAEPQYAEATKFASEAGADARVAVVILLGTNDSKPNNWDAPGRRERFVADYGKLIDHFAGLPTHPTVYVATPLGAGKEPCCGIRGDVLQASIIPAVEEIAKAHGAPVVDLTPIIAGHPELLVDGVHPNDKGYEEIASKVREVLTSQPPKPQAGSSWWSRIH
jgi:lysophospholipase L1-like esterase